MLNLVVIRGRLARPAACQQLPSDAVLLRWELRVDGAGEGGRAETVPVVWFDPPAWSSALDAGEEVVVVGRVRRRFFRAGGATQSRTEVVAERAARWSSRRRAARLVEEAVATLEAATGAGAL